MGGEESAGWSRGGKKKNRWEIDKTKEDPRGVSADGGNVQDRKGRVVALNTRHKLSGGGRAEAKERGSNEKSRAWWERKRDSQESWGVTKKTHG